MLQTRELKMSINRGIKIVKEKQNNKIQATPTITLLFKLNTNGKKWHRGFVHRSHLIYTFETIK